MPQAPGPAVLKKRLGEALRRMRTAKGIEVPEAAAELGSSEGKVRHIELGRNLPSKPDLKVLCALYEADAAALADLEELRQAASKPGWWSTYRLPAWLQSYVGLESDASFVGAWSSELIPGLGQIEETARQTHVLTPHLLGTGDVERPTAARMTRIQNVIYERQATYHAIFSEAALHRLRVMPFAKKQYRHLVELSELPNVTFNVLPFSAGMHESMSGNFVLLDFPTPAISTRVAYLEYATSGELESNQKTVAGLFETFDRLRERALDNEETAEFIKEWI